MEKFMFLCLVIGGLQGYERALDELDKLINLNDNCYYHASLGEMYLKTCRNVDARIAFEKALGLTQSKPEKQLIRGKIERCG